ncbi:hypothetical protein D8I35_05185 [Corticibacter populi]|uniref:DUF3352 domain-containing protein n=1 Tax=Corticibacter populi TaxID=1550736 RepID=A0A3M6QZM2_9BURK|nr:hypothetical protein D8I35_05185 [Corticibacter populi]
MAAGCSSSDDNAPLAYAPAESIYIAANLAPLSDGGVQLVETLFQPLVPMLLSFNELIAADADRIDSEKDLRIKAFLRYLQKTSDAEGLAGFGIDLKALYALYEIELRPVLRVSLQNPDKLRKLMAELEKAAGRSFPVQQHGTISYWSVPLKENLSDSDAAALLEGTDNLREALPGELLTPEDRQALADSDPHLLIAIASEHLVVALDTRDGKVPLDTLLGVQKPKHSMLKAGTLETINKQYGLAPYGTFWLDSQRLLPLLGLGPDAELARTRSLLKEPLDTACAQEITALAGKVPGMLSGYSNINATRAQLRTTLLLEPLLREDFRPVLAPLAGTQPPGAGIELGGSLRLDRLAGFIQKQVSAIQAKPFQCDQLQFINATAASPRLAKTLAPLYMGGSVGTGIYVRMTGLDTSGSTPLPEGMVLWSADNPQALLSYLTLAEPSLATLRLQPGELPKALAAEQFESIFDSPQPMPMWVAMGPHWLGLAAGESARNGLAQLQQDTGTMREPLLFTRYSGTLLADTLHTFSATLLEELREERANAHDHDDHARADGDVEEDGAEDLEEPTGQERLAEQRANQWLQSFFDASEAFLRNIDSLSSELTLGEYGLEQYDSLTLRPQPKKP